MLRNKKLYFFLSFIEGASVMAAELLGAKMLAPYFGSSLYVWASVLAITLIGLAAGYFAGGVLSYRSKNPLALFNVLLSAAAFTMLMPFTSRFVLWAIGMHSLIPSVIFSSLCILFPPVFMMGMVSPLIIRSVTENIEQSGRMAGVVYAISTVGGIIATFAFGFWVIPVFGLTIPSILTGLVLGLVPVFIIIQKKKYSSAAGMLLLAAFCFYTSSYRPASNIKVVYESEGLLGQLMVLDFPHYDKQKKQTGTSRWLFVNRISQTMYDSLADESAGEEKYFTYVYRISELADSLKSGAKVLLMGLGGGSIAKTLSEKGLDVEVCELDRRIAMVARKYFYVEPKVHITVDDARHFIRNCKKKYDLIIFDMFRGEDPPNHVFTVESLEETKSMMNPGGILMVNSLGYIEGRTGRSMRSIYKTFLAAGFNTKILATDPDPNQRNLLFYASLTSLPRRNDFISERNIMLEDAVVLRDEYPMLDVLNAAAAQRWRILAISSFRGDKDQQAIPLFR